MTTLADVAASLGLPVFPCDHEKRPLTSHGFKDATDDPRAIRAMFDHSAAVLIGMPTGRRTGRVVVDVDMGLRKDGTRKVGAAWLDENSNRLPSTRTHRTIGGGLHLVFRFPHDVDIRNSAGKLGDDVDVRGEGGYIILPPSPGYSVADDSDLAEMPPWLIDACCRPEPKPAPVLPERNHDERRSKYAQAALDGEYLAVSRAAEGQRNHQLNVSAVKLGSMVASGLLSRATVEGELTRAGHAAGLDAREIALTIASGLRHGVTTPREVPERKERNENINAAGSGELADRRVDRLGAESAEEVTCPLPLIWAKDAAPNLDASDFVEGLLTDGAMSVVYGESNCGKTFFATDLALHIATGRDWRKRAIEAGAVIYCALEGSHGISNRVAAFKIANNLQGVELPFAIVPVSLDLLDPEADASRLIAAIKYVANEMGCKVRLVVLDTLSRAIAGGNENSSEDMGALVRNGDLIRQETGAHIMWIHHSGKDSAKGARGHSLLRAATDTEIEVSRANKDAPSVAKVVKQREMEIEGEFGFTLKTVELGINRRGKPVKSCVVEEVTDEAVSQSVTGAARLSPTAVFAMQMFDRAMSKRSGQLPPGGDYPANTHGVTVTDWKREFDAAVIVDSAPGKEADARRQKWHRATSELTTARRLLATFNGFVWRVKDTEGA